MVLTLACIASGIVGVGIGMIITAVVMYRHFAGIEFAPVDGPDDGGPETMPGSQGGQPGEDEAQYFRDLGDDNQEAA